MQLYPKYESTTLDSQGICQLVASVKILANKMGPHHISIQKKTSKSYNQWILKVEGEFKISADILSKMSFYPRFLLLAG